MQTARFTALLLLAGISLALLPGCRKNEPDAATPGSADDPVCPVERALIDREEILTSGGGVRTHQYTYDAQNRVISITNQYGLYTEYFAYRGNDSVVATSEAQPQCRMHFFNSAGQQLGTDRYTLNEAGDTTLMELERYVYNVAGEMLEQRYYTISFANGVRIDTTGPSTVLYHWEDGNVDWYHFQGPGDTLYIQYLAGTNGSFLHNFPYSNTRMMYGTGTRPKLSKNLPANMRTRFLAAGNWKYTFDQSGRVKTYTDWYGDKYTYYYRCP